jgi:hypothetical protein
MQPHVCTNGKQKVQCNTLNLGYKISLLISTKFRCYPLLFFLFVSFFLNKGELFVIYEREPSGVSPGGV